MRFKSFWKTKGFKGWFFISCFLTALLVTSGSILSGHKFVYETMNSVFGGERKVLKTGDPSQYEYFKKDYKNKKEAFEAGNILNEKIVEEGMVLLKNQHSLPLKKSAKVTVFGKNSTNLVYGGSGSSAGVVNDKSIKDIYDSLDSAGFDVNPVLKEFYLNDKLSGDGRPNSPGMDSTETAITGFPIGETPLDKYKDNIKDSFKEYNDAALIVISRIAGEGFDLPRTMFWDNESYQNWDGQALIPGARSKEDHYLQLDQNETDIINLASENFDNVVILLNTPSTFELGFLDDVNHYAYNEKVKGCIWMGAPGKSGFMAIGRILNGEINPSGRTVDTYVRDFKQDPTWNNFGNNLKKDGNRCINYSQPSLDAYSVNYKEGIYTGYRYYETRGLLEGENWYKNHVVYPFGYGLSYTNFTHEIISANSTDLTLGENDEVIIEVKVTNIGDIAGKDVVQLYSSAPYKKGEIEKPVRVLQDFKKTSLLKPNESEILTLKAKVFDLASYDFNDANSNNFKGYELDEGTYTFYVSTNAHDTNLSQNYSVLKNIKVAKDPITNTSISNLFDDVSLKNTTYLSRTNFINTWPSFPDENELLLNDKFVKNLCKYQLNDKISDSWYSEKSPVQQAKTLSYKDTKVKLYDLIKKEFTDPLWDELLNQLTIKQMLSLIQCGIYHTNPIDNIAKPKTLDCDGPMGFGIFMGDPSVYDVVYYASETLLASTYNIDLANEYGKMIGNESLIGNENGDGSPYSGWYAPAVNLHRSQFGGRNFEYYSEDPIISGKMAANTIQGAKSKGVYTYVKHFALNNQETNRDTNGLITWANEQCMRELYFKPFEYAVKYGQTNAMMSSFNRIGTTWTGGSYNLLTKLLREEWGFKGMVITDFNLQDYMDIDQMIRAGGDINLSQVKYLKDTTSPTALTNIRRAAKNILYTVANSNAMNGFGDGVIFQYIAPTWLISFWVLTSLVIAGLLAWGSFFIKETLKIEQNASKTGFYFDGEPYKKTES